MNPVLLMKSGAQRCHAKSKTSGQQCRRPALRGATVCYFHGANAPHVKLAAIERLLALQHPAIDTMSDLMTMRQQFPSTAYSAARDVLDRTLGKAAEKVEHTHHHAHIHLLMQGRQRALEMNKPDDE